VAVEVFVCTGYALDGSPLTIPELRDDEPGQLATLSWEELREHVDDGVRVGSHTVTHAHLPRLSDREVRSELSDSRREVEDRLGGRCEDLAYPYGEYDERIRKLVREAGYTRAYALWDGSPGDPYALPRLDLYRRHTPARAVLLAARPRRFRLSR
jgi:peptidoglycan/xylan/chitin deacetylase (PgdA/CDA1 family)